MRTPIGSSSLWNRSPGLEHRGRLVLDRAVFRHQDRAPGVSSRSPSRSAQTYNLTGDGEPERVGAIRVSSNLLPMLGARAGLGRLFTTDEDAARPDGHGRAELRHVGAPLRIGDPGVVGRALTLNGQTFQIVGVLPASFSLPREVMPTLGVAEDGELLLPLPLAANAAAIRTREDYNIIGKLARGVTIAGGAGRDRRHHGAAAARFSGRISAERRSDVQRRAVARSGGGRRAPAGAGCSWAPWASSC